MIINVNIDDWVKWSLNNTICNRCKESIPRVSKEAGNCQREQIIKEISVQLDNVWCNLSALESLKINIEQIKQEFDKLKEVK